MVCANCGSESHRTGDLSCQNYCALNALNEHRQKKKHVSVAAHAVEPAVPRASGHTELSAYATRAAKHAAAQSTETLGASNALSTSARNAQPRCVQKGTIGTTAPRRLTQFAHSARDWARRGAMPNAAVSCMRCSRTHRLRTHFECPEHILHSAPRG